MEGPRIWVLGALTLAVLGGGILALGLQCDLTGLCEGAPDLYATLHTSEREGASGFVYYAILEESRIVEERARWKGASSDTIYVDDAQGNGTEVILRLAVRKNGVPLELDDPRFHLPNGTGTVHWESDAAGAGVAAGDRFDLLLLRGDEDPQRLHRVVVEIAG